ncbi:MAG TPA: hydroxysqualene dehydroxylase HpnE [Acidimicrobiales bacterium]|nr:hydroxysqualene dehydroxylase HpnE [Acidimicrobiales bacterium]
MNERPHVAIVGGGLAGLAAALDCADAGARVTLLERRQRLGGLTWSFEHNGLQVDNGQHVFLRCCREYLSFLDRIGARGDVTLQERLDIPVLAPGSCGAPPTTGRLRRSGLPAPLQLAGSLLRYPHLPLSARLQLGRGLTALRRLSLDDPSLDEVTFGEWLRQHGQSEAAVATVWDLITVPTLNLPAAEASLALAAMVFKTGLLEDAAAADIGWSRVPLGSLHGERASVALAEAGVAVRLGARIESVMPDPIGGFSIDGAHADAAIVALPHEEAARVLPPGAVAHQSRLAELGDSSIVDVHLFYDRPVTTWPLMAAVHSPIQWVFDRTESSGLTTGQYLAVSISASDDLFAERPSELASRIGATLERLLPSTHEARIVDSLVTKERRATFRAVPGTASLRPAAQTSVPCLAVAGAWTDTGWPATMEGAVRSGREAARAALAAVQRIPVTKEVA